jgi:prepilin-type N-terminal cleavage/methylation domain-containing protein
MHSPDSLRASASRGRGDRGFTLVEILIAIVLVGVLSAVVVVGIGSLTSQGSNSACKASADAARAATTVHFTTTGSRPNNLQAMIDSRSLTFGNGVTLDSTGLIATGNGWTMSMTPGAAPTFVCTTGATPAPTPTAAPSALPAAPPPITNGLVSQLDANALAGMFQDSAGTSPATSGQRVCRWSDTSGTNTNAVQATSAQCPVYGSDAKGGYIDFDANGFLTVTPTLSPDFTVFVVAQSDTPTWNAYAWLMSGRGPNGLILHAAPGTRSVGFYVDAGTATYLGNLTVGDITVPHIYKLSAAGSTASGYYAVDGANTPYTMTAGGRTAGAVPLRLGSDDLTGRLGDGRFREVLIFNRALSTTEMAQVEAYLTTKWKLG